MLSDSEFGSQQITVKLAVPQRCDATHCEINMLNFRFENNLDSFADDIHIILGQLCSTVGAHWRGLHVAHAQQFESQLTSAGWCAVHTTGVHQHLLWLVQNCEGGLAWIDTLVNHDRSVWFQHATEAAFFKIHISQ